MKLGNDIFIKIFSLLTCIFNSFFSFAQTDAAKIIEAQYALEKVNDCNSAKQALAEVSEAGRNQQLFVYYSAKTYDCLQDYDNAITYYNKYLEFVPNNTEILQRVAELSYSKRLKTKREHLDGTWLKGTGSEFLITQSGTHIRLELTRNNSATSDYTGLIFEGDFASDTRIEGTKYHQTFSSDSYTDDNLKTCKMCSSDFFCKGHILISNDGNSLEIYTYDVQRYTTGEDDDCCKIRIAGDGNKFAYKLTRVLK